MLTVASVLWAESIVAISSSSGLVWLRLVWASGYSFFRSLIISRVRAFFASMDSRFRAMQGSVFQQSLTNRELTLAGAAHQFLDLLDGTRQPFGQHLATGRHNQDIVLDSNADTTIARRDAFLIFGEIQARLHS